LAAANFWQKAIIDPMEDLETRMNTGFGEIIRAIRLKREREISFIGMTKVM